MQSIASVEKVDLTRMELTNPSQELLRQVMPFELEKAMAEIEGVEIAITL